MKLSNRFTFIFLVSFLILTLASCAGINQGLKNVNEGLKTSLADSPTKSYDFGLDTRLLVLRTWVPEPKPGCLITSAKSISDDMVKIARIAVTAPKNQDGSYQKVPVDRMRGIFINEVCAVGGDGYIDYETRENSVVGTAWAFKNRMKVPYN